MGDKEIIDLRDWTPGKKPESEKKQEPPGELKQDTAVPEQIGPYRLIRVIAEGGMGTVYLAEQDKPIKRSVALKVIKVGMDTREVIARFDAERQALAMMDHPSIARVLDGGATENGRPYFVMELVKGMPVTRYCDEESLSTQSRLEEAGDLHRRVWEIRKELLGPEHPKTLGSAGNLSSVYVDWGRFMEAEKLYLDQLESETRILGGKNPSTITTMSNLAMVYRRQGKLADAEALQERALEMREQALGRDHPDTIDSMFELAQIYEGQERWKESEALFSKVLKLRQEVLGEEHPATLRALEYLAVLLAKTDRVEEAQPIVMKLIRMRKAEAEVIGAGPLALHECGTLLLTCMPEVLRDPESALIYCTRANELTEYRIPSFLRYLALAYHRTGNSQKAAEFQKRALKLLPEGNPDRAEFEAAFAEIEEAL